MTDKPAESAVERYGHWCGFCQTYHSSVSCFHPSNPARYVHPETGHGSATGVNEPGVMTAYVEDWRERAMQAEAKLAAAEEERDKYKWAAEQASEFYFVCKDKDEQREMGDDCGRKPYFWLYELEQVLARYQPGDAACRAYRPEPKED